jgi:hypothetical protein
MLGNILFQLLALISNIVTQPDRQASFHTVWSVFETNLKPDPLCLDEVGGEMPSHNVSSGGGPAFAVTNAPARQSLSRVDSFPEAVFTCFGLVL